MRARTGYSTTDNAYRDVWKEFFASRWKIVGYGGDGGGRCSSDWINFFWSIFNIISRLSWWGDNFIHLERLSTGGEDITWYCISAHNLPSLSTISRRIIRSFDTLSSPRSVKNSNPGCIDIFTDIYDYPGEFENFFYREISFREAWWSDVSIGYNFEFRKSCKQTSRLERKEGKLVKLRSHRANDLSNFFFFFLSFIVSYSWKEFLEKSVYYRPTFLLFLV